MTRHAQQLLYRYPDPRLHREEDELYYRDFGFPEESGLAIAYAISERAITWLGPVFWICLAYLLVVAEFPG